MIRKNNTAGRSRARAANEPAAQGPCAHLAGAAGIRSTDNQGHQPGACGPRAQREASPLHRQSGHNQALAARGRGGRHPRSTDNQDTNRALAPAGRGGGIPSIGTGKEEARENASARLLCALRHRVRRHAAREGIDPVAFWFSPNIHPVTEYRARLEAFEGLRSAGRSAAAGPRPLRQKGHTRGALKL